MGRGGRKKLSEGGGSKQSSRAAAYAENIPSRGGSAAPGEDFRLASYTGHIAEQNKTALPRKWPEGIVVGPSTPSSKNNGQRVAAIKKVLNELISSWPEAAELGIQVYYADDDTSTPFAEYISGAKSDPAIRHGMRVPDSRGYIKVPFSGRKITELVPIEDLTPSLMLYGGDAFGFPPAFYSRRQSLAGEEISPPVFVFNIGVGDGPVSPDPDARSIPDRWRRSWPHYHEILARHEVGHLIADTIVLRHYGPDFDNGEEIEEDGYAWTKRREKCIEGILTKYGITPEELADLSPYAISSPHEAFAELYAATISNLPMNTTLREKFLALMRAELPAHTLPETTSLEA